MPHWRNVIFFAERSRLSSPQKKFLPSRDNRWDSGAAMRRIVAVAGGLIGTLAALWWATGLAQQAETTLPEVEVTAPRVPPAPPRPTAGVLGKTRVEESKWPVIPCAGAHIGAAGGAGTCQVGPMIMSSMAYMPGGNSPAAYGSCTIHHQLVSTAVGRFAVEADVEVFDPYKVTGDPYNGWCMVWSGYNNLPADFRDMNQVARRGVGWRDFAFGGGRANTESTMAFDDGGRGCAAIERLGPPWHGGLVWVLHATLCQF